MEAPNSNRRRWPGSLLLGFLTLSALVALVLTRPPRPTRPVYHSRSLSGPLVDERLLQAAQALAALASTEEEVNLARQARDLADADVDLAFAIAIREAENQPVLTPEARAIEARVSRATLEVQKGMDLVSKLEQRVAGTHTSNDLREQLDLAKAQLALSQDQLSEAQQDFQRAGGDVAGRIRNVLQQHQLSRHDVPVVSPEGKSPKYGTSNLVAQTFAWYDLRGKVSHLESARFETEAAVAALLAENSALSARAEATYQKLQRYSSAGKSGMAGPSIPAKTEYLTLLKRQADDEKTLSELEKRIDARKQLAAVYSQWLVSVAFRERAELHGIIASLLWILIVVQVIRFSEPLSQRVLRRIVSDEPKRTAYRTVIRFASQALGFLFIIMVVFGIPNELPPAILGIVGAALAVILKDFTVSFFDTRIRGVVAAYNQPSNSSK